MSVVILVITTHEADCCCMCRLDRACSLDKRKLLLGYASEAHAMVSTDASGCMGCLPWLHCSVGDSYQVWHSCVSPIQEASQSLMTSVTLVQDRDCREFCHFVFNVFKFTERAVFCCYGRLAGLFNSTSSPRHAGSDFDTWNLTAISVHRYLQTALFEALKECQLQCVIIS